MHNISLHLYISHFFNYFLGCYKKSECNILQYSSDDKQVANQAHTHKNLKQEVLYNLIKEREEYATNSNSI